MKQLDLVEFGMGQVSYGIRVVFGVRDFCIGDRWLLINSGEAVANILIVFCYINYRSVWYSMSTYPSSPGDSENCYPFTSILSAVNKTQKGWSL